MPPRTDLRKQVAGELERLRPAYEEYLTLLKVQDALKGSGSDGRRAPTRTSTTGRRGPGRPAGRRGPGRPPGKQRVKATASRTARRGGRRRAGDTRADQALELIRANPGMSVPQIAERMGIRQNYLYRVTSGLQKQKKITRRNGGFHAA
jgi:hypothetical protein